MGGHFIVEHMVYDTTEKLFTAADVSSPLHSHSGVQSAVLSSLADIFQPLSFLLKENILILILFFN